MATIPGFVQQGLILFLNFISALGVITCNKAVFPFFPYPGLLSTIHYAISSIGMELQWRLQSSPSSSRPKKLQNTFLSIIPPQHRMPFYGLVVSWALCTPLSNGSLQQNSVGFYQMAKILTTPTVVLVNYLVYKELISWKQGGWLCGACIGVGLVTINDFSLTVSGAILALLSVYMTAAQKIMNRHVQQHCGVSSSDLMRACMPLMTIGSAMFAPIMDPPGGMTTLLTKLSASQLGLIAVSGMAGLCASLSATMVYGKVGVLAHILLGQLKLCSVLLVGAMVYDAPTNLQSKVGATLGVLSIMSYTLLSVNKSSTSTPSTAATKLPLAQRDHKT